MLYTTDKPNNRTDTQTKCKYCNPHCPCIYTDCKYFVYIYYTIHSSTLLKLPAVSRCTLQCLGPCIKTPFHIYTILRQIFVADGVPYLRYTTHSFNCSSFATTVAITEIEAHAHACIAFYS